MRLRIVKIGRVAYPELRTLARMYEERLAPFCKIEGLELKDESGLERLLQKPASEHPLVLLDERGREWRSKELAAELQRRIDDPGIKSLTFVIGGPLGLSAALRREAQVTWSLSKATLTSDMAWLLVWEQVYRGFNILKGTGYHHE